MFTDRRDAGLQLAEKLKHYKNCKGVLVLVLPRGGAVPGFEIAHAIGAPLDVLIVRKIGFPGQLELAIGAVSETGAVVLNQRIISYGGVSKKYIEDEISAQKKEIDRRIRLYRGGRPDLAGNALGKAMAPTLLIVGGEDHVVIELNKTAYDMIKAEKQLKIMPGATHIFEEPGTLEEAARLAADWFKKYLITTQD